MTADLESKCREILVELKLAGTNDPIVAKPLTGGVASDIARVEVSGLKYCVKFALPKLKVQADWFAPVHRNAAEYAWLEVASDIAPQSAIKLFGRSKNLHGFVMEFLEGEDIYLWKSRLLAEAPDQNEASKVGEILGLVHQASSKNGFDTTAFQNRDDFFALRIEPYLTYTASIHDDLAKYLGEIAEQLYNSNRVLVHGDASPKNIIFRKTGPVILDAECATMGDASFDISFCMNHLVLKAIHLPGSRHRYLSNVEDLWNAYTSSVSWESPADLEQRVCKLLPALMLGRVDGKSPVEYLSERERKTVRRIARKFIKAPVDRLNFLIQQTRNELEEAEA